MRWLSSMSSVSRSLTQARKFSPHCVTFANLCATFTEMNIIIYQIPLWSFVVSHRQIPCPPGYGHFKWEDIFFTFTLNPPLQTVWKVSILFYRGPPRTKISMKGLHAEVTPFVSGRDEHNFCFLLNSKPPLVCHLINCTVTPMLLLSPIVISITTALTERV